MKRIHSREKKQFEKLFKQEDIDNFEDRYKILEVFLQTERHLTANELVELLHDNRLEFEPDFVRETLKLMCRFGFASQMRFDNGHIRYEHRHLGHHHDHMICTKCRNIFEFEDEKLEHLQAEIAVAYGFHMLQHQMEIYGICAKCREDRDRLLPLTRARQGERLIIKEITGGTHVRMRILTMGLRIEDIIEVVTNLSKGPLVVASDFKRYVLGRGLAQKIVVEPVSGLKT